MSNDPNSKSKSTPIRIVIVDDHPLMREGLREVLERQSDLKICGEAEDRVDGLAVIEKVKPDLVIVDLALKTSHGFELIKDISARFPKTRVLVVSMHDELINAERAIRAGARGYITKQEAITRIQQAVRSVVAGQIYLSEKAAMQIASKVAGRTRIQGGIASDALTDRELQVFEMIGRGLTVRQIAAELQRDASTIETYRVRIREKLNIKDSVELLQAAIKWNSSVRI